jgi:hypothetical protein
MYKKIMRLFLIMIVMNTAGVMGKEGNQSGGESSIVNRAEITACNCGMVHRLGVHIGRDGERTITDTISYYTGPTYVEDYSDFMSSYQTTGDDSVVTRIHLLTTGIVNQFHVMTRVLDVNGNMVDDYAPVDVWVYGPAFQQDDEGLWHSQYPSMANTYDGTMPSTIQLLMPYTIPTVFFNSNPENHFNNEGQWDPWAVTTGGWNVFDFPTWTLDGLGINVNSDSLGVPDEMLHVYVGYNMSSTDASGSVVENIATIWQDGTPDPNDNWSCRSTLHSIDTGGAWYGIWNGEFPYHHLTQAVVQYEAVPPFVEQLPNFSDTWAEEKEVWADVVDLDGDAFACTLNVTIAPEGGNSYDQEIAMVQDLEVEGRYIANVTMAVGDTVNFYVRSTDVTGRSSTSSWRSFIRVSEPNILQHVLVLQDGTRDSLGQDNWGSIYTSPDGLNPILDGSSNYYIWNVNDRNGVDYEVINHPNFDLIVKHGWGGGTMPSIGEDPNGFGDFLDRGGRLLYSDMDYFWKTGLADVGIFSPGDFAYDYLGLLNYINDPDNDEDGTNGGSGDINHFGVDNDPITNTWENSAYGPLDYELMGWTNWGDHMTVSLADYIFIGDASSNKTGSRYNGLGFNAPFKTVYFAFPIEAAQDFTALLSNSVDWLMGYGGPEGTIAQATPQDGATVDLSTTDQLTFLFGGSVSDPDDDLIGYKVVLEGDLAGIEVPATDGISASVSTADVTAMIGENQSLTGTWKVVATDGLESIESGTRTLTVVTGTLSSVEELFPKQFMLMGNYPNPFNPETRIRIEIPLSANVTIIISDILGREVSRLGNQVYSQGMHSFGWDGKSFSGNNLPSGVYLYDVVATELNTGNQLYRATDKMILMK